jgi:hypothetical protein
MKQNIALFNHCRLLKGYSVPTSMIASSDLRRRCNRSVENKPAHHFCAVGATLNGLFIAQFASRRSIVPTANAVKLRKNNIE